MAEISPPTPQTFTTTAKGLVPAPGTSPGTTFLRDDATFATPTASTNYGQVIAARMGAFL